MTTNTTDHLQALRRQVADVEERHARDCHKIEHDLGSVWGFTETETIDRCFKCDVDWPCDTANLARQMTTLLDAIEEIRQHPYSLVYWMDGRIDAAIASAAQEQEGN